MFHLVFDARLEVAQESEWLLVLKLSELSWSSMHEVIQLGHEDGSSPSLILGSFVTCGVTDNNEWL